MVSDEGKSTTKKQQKRKKEKTEKSTTHLLCAWGGVGMIYEKVLCALKTSGLLPHFFIWRSAAVEMWVQMTKNTSQRKVHPIPLPQYSKLILIFLKVIDI